jgi:fermentation-respiration switch protein FrsA (DUF1100 family)
VQAPVLIELGTADPTVLPQMAQQMYDAVAKAPRRLALIKHGTHYYENQPEQLAEALDVMGAWVEQAVQ